MPSYIYDIYTYIYIHTYTGKEKYIYYAYIHIHIYIYCILELTFHKHLYYIKYNYIEEKRREENRTEFSLKTKIELNQWKNPNKIYM